MKMSYFEMNLLFSRLIYHVDMQGNRSRLPMWAMSYFPTHVANAKIPHCPLHSKKMAANPPRAFCTEKITKCPTQYLPPLFCFGLTHAPVSNWNLLNLTKEKRLTPFFLLLPTHHPIMTRHLRMIKGFLVT